MTRDQAIARAASDATVQGKIAWTRVASKLVTYGESSRLFGTPGLGYVDPTDGDALVWLVAYVGPLASAGDYCEWVVRAYRADNRIATDWSASLCGPKGQWPADIDLFPDRSWFRLDDLRG